MIKTTDSAVVANRARRQKVPSVGLENSPGTHAQHRPSAQIMRKPPLMTVKDGYPPSAESPQPRPACTAGHNCSDCNALSNCQKMNGKKENEYIKVVCSACPA